MRGFNAFAGEFYFAERFPMDVRSEIFTRAARAISSSDLKFRDANNSSIPLQKDR